MFNVGNAKWISSMDLDSIECIFCSRSTVTLLYDANTTVFFSQWELNAV